MKITIGFSKPPKWKPYSWLIMTGYGTPYSHVYVKYRSEKYDRDLIYQASGTMVNFMGAEVFAQHAKTVKEFDIEVSDATKNKVMQFAIDNAGKPYGVWSAVGLALVRICEIFGKKIKNPFSDGNRSFVCCEIAAAILQECIGIEVETNLDMVTPKELYDLLTQLSSSVDA